jgi:hypothetical protein
MPGVQEVVIAETGFNSHLGVSANRLRQPEKTEKNELGTKREQDAIAAMPRQLRASLQNTRFLGDISVPIDAFATITH